MGSRKTTKGSGGGVDAATQVQEPGKETTEGNQVHLAPRSLAIAKRGVRSGQDFANLMSALMSDVIEERISPVTANAAVNAGSKLLKVVEMQYRYGEGVAASKQRPDFMLTGPQN